jgi:hypothetical protein
MPVNTLRLSSGFRPGKRNRRGFGGGRSGSIRFQSSSGSILPDMVRVLACVHSQYVRGSLKVFHFVSVSKVIVEIVGRRGIRSLAYRIFAPDGIAFGNANSICEAVPLTFAPARDRFDRIASDFTTVFERYLPEWMNRQVSNQPT